MYLYVGVCLYVQKRICDSCVRYFILVSLCRIFVSFLSFLPLAPAMQRRKSFVSLHHLYRDDNKVPFLLEAADPSLVSVRLMSSDTVEIASRGVVA